MFKNDTTLLRSYSSTTKSNIPEKTDYCTHYAVRNLMSCL